MFETWPATNMAGDKAPCGQDYYTAESGDIEKPDCNGQVILVCSTAAKCEEVCNEIL